MSRVRWRWLPLDRGLKCRRIAFLGSQEAKPMTAAAPAPSD